MPTPCAERRADMLPPLDGLRVLAVEQYGAGPFGTQHLADLGAEVIKIENRKLGGDYARALGPYFVEGAAEGQGSLFFQSINRNKKSLTLDLGKPQAQEVLHRLVADADAVANNLRGDVPEKLGLTYEALKSANKRIVCTHCSGYGREGPRKTWPGYDFLMQAEAGYFHLSGEPDTPPTRMGLSIVDFMAGTYLAMGLLAGVIGARTSGVGRDVDVNLFDTALYSLSYLSAWALNSDYDPKRVARSAHASLAPCQLYKTKDGWIFVMCNKEHFWPLLCKKIDREELIDDARFISFRERLKNRDELTIVLDEVFQQATTREWLDKLQGGIPVAPVKTPREALEDPKLRANGKIDTLHINAQSTYEMLATPILAGQKIASTPCPPIGADSVDILSDAGYSAEEIAEMKAAGTI